MVDKCPQCGKDVEVWDALFFGSLSGGVLMVSLIWLISRGWQ